ncbi:MAG: trypsin-like serine protease, partial [Bdellovibrionales bacterium]|nr:trypsin-like serine protease [Bdellovibrionales bacterium]
MLKVNLWFIFVSRELIIKRNKLCPIFCALIALVGMLALGCGKKADEEAPKAPRYTNPQIEDLELELAQQELFCGGDDRSCPSYLTKIAIVHKDKLKFCTGFLTEDDVVVTASSCLPDTLRFKEVSCKDEVFFFFAESNEKPTRINCDKVLEASRLEVKEPFLWRSDIVYLKLEKSVKRRTLSASRSGMNNMDKFYIWSVDQID